MQNSKLLQLLKSLSFTELQEFESFLASPYFKVPKNCIRLFELLKDEHPSYNSPTILPTILFLKMFPHKQQQDSSLRVVMSLLTKLLEKYLIQKELEQQPFVQQKALLQSCLKRGLPKHFKKKYTQHEQRNTEQKDSIQAYFQRYEMATILQEAEALFAPKKTKTHPNQIIQLFQYYSTLNHLQLYCHILNTAHIRHIDYDTEKLNRLLDEIAQLPLKDHPTIELYYHMVCLLNTQDDTYFKQLKPILLSNETVLSSLELQGLCIMTLNYCNRKITQGKSSYYAEMLDLYKFMLHKNLLHHGKYIHPSHIRNIATIAIRLEEWTWVAQFIQDYKDKVHPQYSETVFRYNLAVLHFYKKEFRQALEHLTYTTDINVLYQLDYKNLMLKLYFELQEWGAFTSLTAAFRQMVSSKKQLSTTKKKSYRNFIKYITKLYRLKLIPTYRPVTLERLQAEINNSQFVSDRQWLLEQLAHLNR